MSLKTPLYDIHLKLGGKIVDFGGYLLPIQYPKGIIQEHLTVRNDVGLFDVSHMAELWIEGKDATHFLNSLITNDIRSMKSGQMKYTLMCNPNGTIIDDLLVYKISDTKYLLVCNAGNHQKDVKWISQHVTGEVHLNDLSHETGLVALQGPKALESLTRLVEPEKLPTKYYTFKENVEIAGIQCLVSRNGYTGEDGFEIATHADDIVSLYNLLLENGAKPCGLGARDTLRLEAGMPLYGHEMSEDINPYEAGLGFFVKLDKDDFIGKEVLQEKPMRYVRVGLKMLDRGIAREGSRILLDDQEVGFVSSGTQLPSLQFAGAMGFVIPKHGTIGTELLIDVRGRLLKAQIIKLPFYKRDKKEEL